MCNWYDRPLWSEEDVHPPAEGMSMLKLLRLKRALPLFRVDEPPFLVDLVTLEPEQN